MSCLLLQGQSTANAVAYNHTLTLLQLWRSGVWSGPNEAKVRETAGPRSFCRLYGRICPLAFPASKACGRPCLVDPSSPS